MPRWCLTQDPHEFLVLDFAPDESDPAAVQLLRQKPGLTPGAEHPVADGLIVQEFAAEPVGPLPDCWRVRVIYVPKG
jgi:hypothetical protein